MAEFLAEIIQAIFYLWIVVSCIASSWQLFDVAFWSKIYGLIFLLLIQAVIYGAYKLVGLTKWSFLPSAEGLGTLTVVCLGISVIGLVIGLFTRRIG